MKRPRIRHYIGRKKRVAQKYAEKNGVGVAPSVAKDDDVGREKFLGPQELRLLAEASARYNPWRKI